MASSSAARSASDGWRGGSSTGTAGGRRRSRSCTPGSSAPTTVSCPASGAWRCARWWARAFLPARVCSGCSMLGDGSALARFLVAASLAWFAMSVVAALLDDRATSAVGHVRRHDRRARPGRAPVSRDCGGRVPSRREAAAVPLEPPDRALRPPHAARSSVPSRATASTSAGNEVAVGAQHRVALLAGRPSSAGRRPSRPVRPPAAASVVSTRRPSFSASGRTVSTHRTAGLDSTRRIGASRSSSASPAAWRWPLG